MELAVIVMRNQHPAWGGRKIAKRLEVIGHQGVPAPSTITEILRRHERLNEAEASKHSPHKRFERAQPNELWQMDFKGHLALGNRHRCHPLTVLDDHSRYALCLAACRNEQSGTVKERLTATFRRYGLPEQMLMDNGGPWGHDPEHPHTTLTAWLMHLGVKISHIRPYHPETQGKEERFHRTLKVEVLAQRTFRDFECIQSRFDHWRYVYNHQRPHESLSMAVPASRYQVSPRSFPERLPPLEYSAIDQVRKVQLDGKIFFRNREFKVGKAFRGYPVAVRPTTEDGIYAVYFATHEISMIDLTKRNE